LVAVLPHGLWEGKMGLAITAITVTAGMVFSLAVALLVEELIFGKVFRVLFAQQVVAVKSGQKR
jgi:hypothetical protein